MKKATLGERVKLFEMLEAGRMAMPDLPLVARLDGRAFHTFTRGFERPFDSRMATCMIETTRALVEEFHPVLSYTQSDEISLAWLSPEIFDGRFQKLTSVLAGFASTVFARLADRHIPERRDEVPCFDCRVWQVPSKQDVLDVFVWREDDATKNSLQMAARAHYGHAELHNVRGPQLHDLLHAKGVNWNDFPPHFKRGVYVKRVLKERTLTDEERLRIPEAQRPAADHRFLRASVEVLDLPPIRTVTNALETLLVEPSRDAG